MVIDVVVLCWLLLLLCFVSVAGAVTESPFFLGLWFSVALRSLGLTILFFLFLFLSDVRWESVTALVGVL